ncbi:MAG TPA: hypothetical protein VL147_17745 [Devosia sp.]|nr:hypothetical protein [Devosia sp.]
MSFSPSGNSDNVPDHRGASWAGACWRANRLDLAGDRHRPEFFWELSLGIWLLVKGFSSTALAALDRQGDQATVSSPALDATELF